MTGAGEWERTISSPTCDLKKDMKLSRANHVPHSSEPTSVESSARCQIRTLSSASPSTRIITNRMCLQRLPFKLSGQEQRGCLETVTSYTAFVFFCETIPCESLGPTQPYQTTLPHCAP